MRVRVPVEQRAMDAICELIESECPLESLTIRGSGKLVLRDDTLALLDAVGFNKTLTHLDISGNGMGDSGAFSLGKALQLNSTLRSLSIDNNGITLRGFIAFTIGLARNRSLVKMPLPLFDITNAAKGNLDKTQRLTDEMSSYLARNQNPASFTGEVRRSWFRAFRGERADRWLCLWQCAVDYPHAQTLSCNPDPLATLLLGRGWSAADGQRGGVARGRVPEDGAPHSRDVQRRRAGR